MVVSGADLETVAFHRQHGSQSQQTAAFQKFEAPTESFLLKPPLADTLGNSSCCRDSPDGDGVLALLCGVERSFPQPSCGPYLGLKIKLTKTD